MTWQTFYARWGNVFGLKAPGYGVQGHRGSDVVGVAAGAVIPAYRSGVVRKVQYSSYLGTVVAVEADADGLFDGYCHARDGVLVTVGQRVGPGTGLGYVAGWGDRHGSSWDGEHVHLTRSPTLEGVFSGVVFDPRPTVLAAIAAPAPSAPASVGATTINASGDDDMAAIQIILEIDKPVGSQRYGVIGGEQGFSHIETKNGVDGMVQVNALLVGIGQTHAQHVRGVNGAEFDAIATALTR